jgi:hypothetical protein
VVGDGSVLAWRGVVVAEGRACRVGWLVMWGWVVAGGAGARKWEEGEGAGVQVVSSSSRSWLGGVGVGVGVGAVRAERLLETPLFLLVVLWVLLGRVSELVPVLLLG